MQVHPHITTDVFNQDLHEILRMGEHNGVWCTSPTSLANTPLHRDSRGLPSHACMRCGLWVAWPPRPSTVTAVGAAVRHAAGLAALVVVAWQHTVPQCMRCGLWVALTAVWLPIPLPPLRARSARALRAAPHVHCAQQPAPACRARADGDDDDGGFTALLSSSLPTSPHERYPATRRAVVASLARR